MKPYRMARESPSQQARPAHCRRTGPGRGRGRGVGVVWGVVGMGVFAALSALGEAVTFRELCARLVQLDEATRCEPEKAHAEVYARQLSRQTELTSRLHGAGYL